MGMFDSYYDFLKKEYLKKMQPLFDKAVDNANKKILQTVKEDVENIMYEVADDFYMAYEPSMYDRRGTLYETLKIQVDDHKMHGDFDDSMFTYRNGQLGQLYNSVMKQGYHGGPGIPVPLYTHAKPYNGDPQPWNPCIPWEYKIAETSTPPLESFFNRLHVYEGFIQDKYNELVQQEIANII